MDINGYLSELYKTGAIPEEDQKVFAKYYAKPELVKFVEEGQLRQSDFSRQQDQLKAEKQALEDEKKTVAALQVEAENKATNTVAQNKKIANDLVKTRQRLASAREYLMAKYEVDEEELKEMFGDAVLEPKVTDKEKANAGNSSFDPSVLKDTYVDNARFNMAVGETIAYQNWLYKTGRLHDSMGFKDANGKPIEFDPDRITNAIVKDPKLTAQAAWEKEYNVAQRRAQLEEERINKLADQRADERYNAKIAEYNGQQLDGAHKPDTESFLHSVLKPPDKEGPLFGDENPMDQSYLNKQSVLDAFEEAGV